LTLSAARRYGFYNERLIEGGIRNGVLSMRFRLGA
jgi:hypothetical protein